MYSISEYLQYCRLEKMIRLNGRAGTDSIETNNKIQEITGRLPASPGAMRKSLEENWSFIVRSMDRGIRERLCFQIPSEDRENFLIAFCARYEKRYGLAFEIPEGRRGDTAENDRASLGDSNIQGAQKVSSDMSSNGPGTDSMQLQYGRQESQRTYERQCQDMADRSQRSVPEDNGDRDLLEALSDDPRSLYSSTIYRPARTRTREKPQIIIVAQGGEKIPSKAEDYRGKLVRYEGKTYRVVDIGYGGYLLIDKETKWSETTAVRKEDVELYRY